MIIAANKKRIRIYILILLTAFVLPFIIHSLKAEIYKPCYVAIVIDDFGNGVPDSQKFFDLEIKFTGAVMPALEHTESDMLSLHKAGKEVIIHMPMESHTGKKSWLGPNALTTSLSDQQIEKNIYDSIKQISYAVGINNHMGSKATEDDRILNILFKIAKEKNLIVIDSKTTPKTKVRNIADKYGIKSYERDVFIDAASVKQVCDNLRQTIKIAMRKGYAIAIGHVASPGGRITADAIKIIADEYKDSFVNFIYISDLEKIKLSLKR